MADSQPNATKPQFCDLMGLPVTCNSEEALDYYNKALVAYLSLRESPLPYVSKAYELDSTFMMAHCFMVSEISQLKCNLLEVTVCLDLVSSPDPPPPPHRLIASAGREGLGTRL